MLAHIMADTVIDRTCPRCGKVFTKECSLKDHFLKKKTCPNTLNCAKTIEELVKGMEKLDRTSFRFICGHCQKKFRTKSNLNQHSPRCKSVSRNKRADFTDGVKMEEIHIDSTLLIEAQRQEIRALKQQIELLKRSNVSTIDERVTNNVTINNTYVVVLNDFGSETTSHILQDKKFLDKCLLSLKRGIPDVVEKIYYDDAKPENKTVILKSSKRKTALVHKDGKWTERDLNQVVPIMVRNSSNILSTHLRNKDTSCSDDDTQQDVLTKHEYLVDVMTHKKPEYDMAASAVKAFMTNYRSPI